MAVEINEKDFPIVIAVIAATNGRSTDEIFEIIAGMIGIGFDREKDSRKLMANLEALAGLVVAYTLDLARKINSVSSEKST
jgi:hypothetical protein